MTDVERTLKNDAWDAERFLWKKGALRQAFTDCVCRICAVDELFINSGKRARNVSERLASSHALAVTSAFSCRVYDRPSWSTV